MPPVPRARVYRLLVVGPSNDLQAIAAEAIRGLECSVVVAVSIGEGVARLGAESCDAALVELTGAEDTYLPSLEKLHEAQPATKIILVVARSTTKMVIGAIRGNAFSLFSRPFEAGLVCKMVRHALQVHQWSDDIELLSALAEFFSLRLRCSLDTADRLVQFCKEMPVELPEEERDEVADAFREMLLNAIEHGGKFNPADWVRVSRVRTNRTLVYHIQDPGNGFGRDELPQSALTNPTGDPIAHMQHRLEQGLRPGGFGMLIVRRLVDEVIYNERGNEVILIKHLD